uniref:Acyl-coenzyme A oxidase n=1 Tax=Xenopsylla cheopis TaxID=163159 RepID=A0A6M2DSR8_XENCH
MRENRDANIHPDLQKERDKCTFDPLELTYFLDGGQEKTFEKHAREQFFLTDPELKDTVPNEYLSHKEKYEVAVRKACLIMKKIREFSEQGHGGVDSYRALLGASLGSAVLKDGNPLTLHYVMFIPTLMGQGTVEQQAEWIGRAWTCSIIGTYAQTELGHGTFIRGLETTATYDPDTQEFVLHSPTQTSFKWWPGGLGHTANYCVVVAQLYTKGECHGIHPFIVQLRDEETHEPMPGITIGEIGTKLGMNATNNGFLGFNKVRIPREQMLMKNAQVLEDGTYVKSPSSKLTYGTMIFVRVVLVQDMSVYLSKAVTIAVRYSAVRRQSQPKPDEPEPQILDYVTQQYKLFPNIAKCFVFRMTSEWLWDMYNSVTSELESGDMERLPELHAMSCCLKVLSTSDAAAGVETCRLACGGHGYMACSNLPAMYGLATAACTYEGENTVLLLQAARYLMKAWAQAVATPNELMPTVKYLAKGAKEKDSSVPWKNTIEGLITAAQMVAAGCVKQSYKNIEKRKSAGHSPEDAWNLTSLELVKAADAHCRAFVIEKTLSQIQAKMKGLSAPLCKVLIQLAELYAVDWALNHVGDLLRVFIVISYIISVYI